MSYILDALKRSEQERHQGELNHPTIDTIMLPRRQAKQQLWPYLLILVLVINLGVYVYFQLFKTGDESSEADLASAEELQQHEPPLSFRGVDSTQKNHGDKVSDEVLPTQGDIRALPEHFSVTPNLGQRFIASQPESLSENQSTVQEENVVIAKTPNKAPQFTDEGLEIIRPKGAALSYNDRIDDVPVSVEREISSTPINAQPQPSVTIAPVNLPVEVDNFDAISHLRELDIGFQRSIPDIKFSSHIYSPSPEARRVMLNDLYLREGQGFSGMTIETIGEFYIVLSKSDQEFKIPVLRDWYRPN